ncbi:MAG TPA: hypothetical protein ENH82_19825 [bacterium]|nr:hypothetical protein [bacterium]
MGPDALQCEDVLKRELNSRIVDVLDYVSLDGDRQTSIDVLDALQQVPFGLDRIVVLRSGNKIDWNERLLSFIEANYQNFQFLVTSVESKVDSMDSRFRLFVKKGRFVSCSSIKDPVKYICSQADINRRTAQFLVTRIGGRYSSIKWALQKLQSFDTEITIEMVSFYIRKLETEEVVDSLLSGGRPLAVGDIAMVVGLLEYKIRQFLIFMSIKWQKVSNKQLSEFLEIPLFVVDKFRMQVLSVNKQKIRRWIFLLCKIDTLRRKGVVDGLFEYLVASW